MNKAGKLLVAVLAVLPLAAEAQSYRCTGKDGKKYYGSTVPSQCVGMPVEQLSPQGTVIRRFDALVNEQDRAAKEAEAAKRREEEAVAKEERRRNNALLATYTSEKDIEAARARALAENDKAIKEIEGRMAEIRKRQASYSKEMEFYSDGAKPAEKADKADKNAKPKAAGPARAGPKPPPKLVEDIRTAEIDMKAQESVMASRKKEIDAINAKYDEDKRRYAELTKPRAGAR